MLQNINNIIDSNEIRPDWDEYFMMCAKLLSSRSTCHRLHVGCVLVKDNRIISSGYNGHLSGAKHISIVKNNHEQATVHAEHNAISDAAKRGVSTNNTIAYITHYPCLNCFKLLFQAGVKKIIYLEDYNNDEIVNDLVQQLQIGIIKYESLIS
jgi:dCMP deaminase